MSDVAQDLALRLTALREAFDRTFAVPSAAQADDKSVFVIIAVAGDRYAMRIDPLLGLEKGRKIVPLPLRVPGLLGLAGWRGRLMPAFHLASLLGAAGSEAPPAWLALCGGEAPVALAFDRFEGARQVAARDVHQAGPASERGDHLRQTVRLPGGSVYVIDVESIVAAVRQRLAGR